MTLRFQHLVAVAALTTGAAFAQNDDCSGAIALTNGNAVAFDTTTATAGTAFACAASGGPDLWYSYTSTINGSGISVETCGSGYDTALEIFDGTCGALNLLQCNDDACGLQSTVTASNVSAGTTYLIRVGGFNGATGTGTIVVNEAVDACAAGTDDMFEENDTCATAVPIMPGSYPNLVCTISDPDHYTITLQNGDQLTVTLVDTPSDDLDLNQYDAACSLVTFWNTDGFSYTNTSGAPEVVNFEVFGDPGFFPSGCVQYDMNVDISQVPTCSMPDMFEDSDDCGTAMPLGDGLYTGLNVQDGDNDYYQVTVADGSTITADIFFIDAFADTDLYLWDPNVACDTNVAGPGTGTGALSVGFSVTDNEQVTYTNTTGAAQTLIVEVDMFTTGGCNDYDLMIDGAGPGSGPGSNYCMANPNSTGATGVMGATGSRVVANNDVTLTASDLPNNATTFFITSQTQGFVPNPAGSAGNLCLGGAIGRYVGPGQIQNTGGTGMASLAIDNTNMPQPMGSVSAMAGETWSFQAWHRDSDGMGGATSNFTDGYAISYI